MRRTTMVCIGLLIVAVIVSVVVWRKPPAERELQAELALPQHPPSGASSTTPSPAVVVEDVAPAPSSATAEHAASRRGTLTELTQSAYGAYALRAATSNLHTANPELLNDPEYRKAQLASLRTSLQQIYAGVAEELGLAPQEADELFDLLAENQLEMNSLAQTLRREAQDRHEEQVASMLGSRYPLLQSYRETFPARQQVMKLDRTLESVGLPLSDTQRRPLVAAYAAEGRNMLDDMAAMSRGAGAGGPESGGRLMEQVVERQSQSNERLLKAAAEHLSPGQMDVLRHEMERQLEMERASARIMREQIESGAGTTSP